MKEIDLLGENEIFIDFVGYIGDTVGGAFIYGLEPDYEFYVRQHAKSYNETVLYAVPRK